MPPFPLPPPPVYTRIRGKYAGITPWKIPALAIAPNKEKAQCGEAKKQGRRRKRRGRRGWRREVEKKRRMAE